MNKKYKTSEGNECHSDKKYVFMGSQLKNPHERIKFLTERAIESFSKVIDFSMGNKDIKKNKLYEMEVKINIKEWKGDNDL